LYAPDSTTPVIVKRIQGPLPVKILDWCFYFTDALSRKH
jgi:hypothetical protein